MEMPVDGVAETNVSKLKIWSESEPLWKHPRLPGRSDKTYANRRQSNKDQSVERVTYILLSTFPQIFQPLFFTTNKPKWEGGKKEK